MPICALDNNASDALPNKVDVLLNKDDDKLPTTHDDAAEEKTEMLLHKDVGKCHNNIYLHENKVFYSMAHEKPQLDNCMKSKWMLILLLVAGAMCLASTSITIAVIVEGSRITEQPLERPQGVLHQSVCLQCIKLIRNPFNNQDPDPLVDRLIKRIDDGIQMCCADNKEQLSLLLEATLKEQVTRPIPVFKDMNSSIKFIPASVHKQLFPHNESELALKEPLFSNGQEHFLVKFNNQYTDPLTEHAHEVTVMEDALQIQHTGLYYVYLNVHMKQKFNRPKTSFNSQRWSQYVHRSRTNSPLNSGILLETVHIECKNCKQHEETAFAGGTFHLEKGDLIQVCGNPLGIIQYRKESSYLGLIMLSSESNL